MPDPYRDTNLKPVKLKVWEGPRYCEACKFFDPKFTSPEDEPLCTKGEAAHHPITGEPEYFKCKSKNMHAYCKDFLAEGYLVPLDQFELSFFPIILCILTGTWYYRNEHGELVRWKI